MALCCRLSWMLTHEAGSMHIRSLRRCFWKFIEIYKRTILRNTTIIFVRHSISADYFGWELNPLQVTLKDVAADAPISITNSTQVILSAKGSAFAYACVTYRKNVQTDRPLGNLIHYSTHDHTVPLLGHVLSFHSMLQCVSMHVVNCLSVHTGTHPSAHLVSIEHGDRVVVSCFTLGGPGFKSRSKKPAILMQVLAVVFILSWQPLGYDAMTDVFCTPSYTLFTVGKCEGKGKQPRYRPGVAQSVPGS